MIQQEVAHAHPMNQRQVLQRLRAMPHDDGQQDLAQRLARPTPQTPLLSQIQQCAGPMRQWHCTFFMGLCLWAAGKRCGIIMQPLTRSAALPGVVGPYCTPVVAWTSQVCQALTRAAPPAPADMPLLVLLADLPGV
jgi:hypothetical protein